MGADTSADIQDANRGNTVIRAQNINIDNTMDVTTNQSEQKFKQSGLTVSVSNSLIDNAKSIDRLIDAGSNTQSTRMKGMAGVAATLKTKALAKQGSDALTALKGGNLQDMGSTRIQATIGNQKSQSNSSSYTEKNKGSSIDTNNLALIATGAGTDSNININGSSLTVSNNALFQADNDLNVNGVAQNSSTRNTSKSSSTALGVYAATNPGQDSSFGITASASKAKGHANSDSTTYANSHINVGGTTTFDIGNDVNIKGGVINTGRAQGTIGGDVNIESLQDTATYDSKQKNMGFSTDIAIKGVGSSLSVNGGKTNLNADYKAVGEQSGLFTGDGGLALTANGKTTLIGGAITTTEAAHDAGRNNYESLGGITTQDIENTTSYEGDAIQVGVSVGNTTGKPQAQMNGIGYGSDGDSDSSVTRAGITGIAGNQDITTDNRAEYAGILENNFDVNQVNKELNAQTQITQEFGKEAPKAVGDYASNRQLNLINEGRVDEADKWAEGGSYRVALHTLVGAIATGSVEGALASGTTAVSIPAVDKYLEKQGVDETTRGALLLGLSAAVGAVVGGDTASTATSFSQTQNNYLNHLEHAELARLKKEKSERSNSYGNCVSVRCAEITKEIFRLEKLDKDRDKQFSAAYDSCRKGSGCNDFYQLHVTQRQEWNISAEKLFIESRSDWIKMKDEENIFHNFNSNGIPEKMQNGQYRYKKFVHKNGQLEVIIDTLDGNLSTDDYSRIVRDPTNAGTYNYYAPREDGLKHLVYDVDPYIDFGNGKNDKTNLGNRRSVPVSKTVMGITIPLGGAGATIGKLANFQIGKSINDFKKSQNLCESDKRLCASNEKK